MTNSQRGFAPILIVLIIIAGAGAVGGGYYNSLENKTKIFSNSQGSVQISLDPSIQKGIGLSLDPTP